MKNRIMIRTTSIIGLGKLGACMAGCFAAKGFHTVGVELNAQFVDAVNAGKAPVDETDLAEVIAKGKNYLKKLHSKIEALDELNEKNLAEIFEGMLNEKHIKMLELAQPVRVAMTGTTVSPGIYEVLKILGKKRVLERIVEAIRWHV